MDRVARLFAPPHTRALVPLRERTKKKVRPETELCPNEALEGTCVRVEILFLRWLLAITILAGAVLYLRSGWRKEIDSPYQTIALVQGGKSSGLPLAGVAIDPDRGDVYAIVGGPAAKSDERAFGIIWKGSNGHLYATAGPSGTCLDTLFEIRPEGGLRRVQKLAPAVRAPATEQNGEMTLALRSMIDSLPDAPAPR